MREMKLHAQAESNPGVRERNEDRFLNDNQAGVYLVCDGMGGQTSGDVAAQVASDTVREALRDLELFGFVVSAPYRGAIVRKIAIEDLVQIYPIRAVLEGLAAHDAATRIDAAGLKRLRRLLATMRRAAWNACA